MVERIVVADEKLREKEQSLIDELNEAYPDRQIARLDTDHKGLGKRATKLYRDLGYASRSDMLEAFGFSPSASQGGRPVEVDAEEILQELSSRYEDAVPPSSYGQLLYDNPDLAPQLKTLSNKAREIFGTTMNKELKRRGILRGGYQADETVDDDEVIALVEALAEVYAAVDDRPKTVVDLEKRHPQEKLCLKALASRAQRIYGMTAKECLRKRGVLADPDDPAVIEAALVAIEKALSGEPAQSRPSTVADLKGRFPEHADAITRGQRLGTATKEALRTRGILAPSKAEVAQRRRDEARLSVRRASTTELACLWESVGLPKVFISRSSTDPNSPLRFGTLGVDLEAGLELRESIVCLFDGLAAAQVGEELSVEVSFDAYGLPGASRPEIILTDAAGASAVWSDARYSRSPFPSRTFKIDSPLKQAVGAEVAAVSECGDKRLVQVRYRFLTEITSETLLWGLWHFGVVSDDDLLGGSEWRTDREGVLAGADSLQRLWEGCDASREVGQC
ncbi:hypothetical protein [Enterorhabdus sp. P55]|uniref:hypothetical protein n=1 Tax=Enterorhabdus sp. P55 TaxID=2304571 RepID=UPI00136F7996|nr:hypothetical protein [Enterorhabdus sp. P55]NBI32163.1 hypothetical protein [Enterorhabdus sp. P55]